MSSWWQLLGLLSWYPAFRFSHCNFRTGRFHLWVTDLEMSSRGPWKGTRAFIHKKDTVLPRGGTPYVMGDTYVPRFWPPFLFTLAGSSTIFLGYFFSSTNTKTIFSGIKTTISYRIRSFRPQISFFPRSFWVQFSAASGTPPSFFGPSTPPPPPPPPPRVFYGYKNPHYKPNMVWPLCKVYTVNSLI